MQSHKHPRITRFHLNANISCSINNWLYYDYWHVQWNLFRGNFSQQFRSILEWRNEFNGKVNTGASRKQHVFYIHINLNALMNMLNISSNDKRGRCFITLYENIAPRSVLFINNNQASASLFILYNCKPIFCCCCRWGLTPAVIKM